MDLFKLNGPPVITLDDDTIINLPYPTKNNFLSALAADETAYKTYATGLKKQAGKRKIRPTFRFELCNLTRTEAETISSALQEEEFTFTPRTKLGTDDASGLVLRFRVRVTSDIPTTDQLLRQKADKITIRIELESIDPSVTDRSGILIVTIQTGNAGGAEAGAGELFQDNTIALVTPEGDTSTLIDLAATPLRADYNPVDNRYYFIDSLNRLRSCTADGKNASTHWPFTGTLLDMLVIQDGPNRGMVFVLENFASGDDRLYRWDPTGTAFIAEHMNSGFTTDMEAVAMCHNSDLDVIAIVGTRVAYSLRHHSASVPEEGAPVNTYTRAGATGITYIHGELIYFVHDGALKQVSALDDLEYEDHTFFVAQGPDYYDKLTGRIYIHGTELQYTFPSFITNPLGANPPLSANVGNFVYNSIAVHR